MREKGKPTRIDLLAVVSSLQGLVGAASASCHDRNPNKQAEVQGYLEQALHLCIEARSFDPSEAGTRSPWQEEPQKPRM